MHVSSITVTREPAWFLILTNQFKRAAPHFVEKDYSYINSVCIFPDNYCCGDWMESDGAFYRCSKCKRITLATIAIKENK